jgi:hypothetical protein
MSRKSDFINQYIRESLLPVVAADGFALYKPKHLIRLRGVFIDSLAFQLSQHGSRSFHLHYATNLLANPLLNLDSYSVGHRISDNRDNGDDRVWCGQQESQAKSALDSVIEAYQITLRAWFDSVSTIPEYLFEKASDPQIKDFNDMDSVIAFAEGGKPNRAWWICTEIIESASVDNDENERKEQTISACQLYLDVSEIESLLQAESGSNDFRLLDALKAVPTPDREIQSIDELLRNWRGNNVNRLKLNKFI